MSLGALTLALLMAFHGASGRDARARLEPIAEAIADAASASPLFHGDAGRVSTAALLAAIAFHESGFSEAIRRCRSRGDGGRSIGLFQLMRDVAWDGHAEDEICASDRLQARLSLRALARFKKVHPRAGPQGWINGYASGDPLRETPAAKRINGLWATASGRANVLSRTLATR